jgi:hypothetical protein
MVPTVAEPPALLLTYHVTAVFEVPVTVAEKVAEAPARTLVVDGETLTTTVAEGGGCWEPGGDAPAPQPATEKAVRRSATNPGNLRFVTRIADSVWPAGASRDNWTKGQKKAKFWSHEQVCVNGVLEECGKSCYTDNAKPCVQGKTECAIIWL